MANRSRTATSPDKGRQRTGSQKPKHERVQGAKGKPASSRKQPSRKRKKEDEMQGVPAVLAEHLTKVYESKEDCPALNDISLRIDQGEFVFLVGHSGSGKSSFIRSIIREIVPDSGKLEVGGYDLIDMDEKNVPYLRRNIGCVFQDFKLLPNKTAYENVAFAMECIWAPQRKIKEHVPEVLALVGLKDKMNMLPEELSGGEQQRVTIARAIINQPPLLVCDEPTGNLDPQTSKGIMDLLTTINEVTNTTVLVATHDQGMVDSMHKRVVRLEQGNLISDQLNGAYSA